jgi:hypothetical protein
MYPNNPTHVWSVDKIGKAVFYYQHKLNERFMSVVTRRSGSYPTVSRSSISARSWACRGTAGDPAERGGKIALTPLRPIGKPV